MIARSRTRTLSFLLLAAVVALVLGVVTGASRHALAADDECTTVWTENCDFWECSGADGWTANDFAVEYDVIALPWKQYATGTSRLKRLSWKDTASGTATDTSWPPMTVRAAWDDGLGGYHFETLTVYENGSTSGSSNIRVWTRNGSTDNLCDGYGGRSQKWKAGSCITGVFYGIDVRDDYDGNGHCLGGVEVTPIQTSLLKAQDPLLCPEGTNLTPVPSPAQDLSCMTRLNIVVWNYE